MTSKSTYRWNIITGEYPPQPGGVSDYTRLVAKGLAEAGDEVHVWAPECKKESPVDVGVNLHRLPGHFGSRALDQLSAHLDRQRDDRSRLLVQYVPQMYGWKAMNVPFCLWLYGRRRHSPWVMFHEIAVAISFKQQLRFNVLGVVTHAMASLVARAASRIFVSIPLWKEKLARMASGPKPITWLPVPSNIGSETSPEAVQAVREKIGVGADKQIIGHFGTFGNLMVPLLLDVFPKILQPDERRIALFLGRNSQRFAENFLKQHPHLGPQVVVGGALEAEELRSHLKVCDVLLQPYPEGVCGRRSSLMAGLALGLPIVTTRGRLTETVWQEGFVELAEEDNVEEQIHLAEQLLLNETHRKKLAELSRMAYKNNFSIDRTVETLRTAE